MARLIDKKRVQYIRSKQERFDALAARMATCYAKVPEKEGAAEIARAVAAARAESRAVAKARKRKV